MIFFLVQKLCTGHETGKIVFFNTSLEFFSTSEFVRVMKYLPTSYEQISKPKTKLQPQEEDERAIKHIKKDVSGR